MNTMQIIREPANTFTHLVGVVLSAIALYLLLSRASAHGDLRHIISFSIYGTSMILLYLASTLYHMLPLSKKGIRVLRRIDHIMIYVLIAGTYTPVALVVLDGLVGWVLLVFIWGTALTGTFFKLFRLDAPGWISLVIYLAMGWAVLGVLPYIIPVFDSGALGWAIAGGLTYTLGAMMYAFKWPNFWPIHFNFHAFWHIMVLAGSFCFFWLMYRYVAYI